MDKLSKERLEVLLDWVTVGKSLTEKHAHALFDHILAVEAERDALAKMVGQIAKQPLTTESTRSDEWDMDDLHDQFVRACRRLAAATQEKQG